MEAHISCLTLRDIQLMERQELLSIWSELQEYLYQNSDTLAMEQASTDQLQQLVGRALRQYQALGY